MSRLPRVVLTLCAALSLAAGGAGLATAAPTPTPTPGLSAQQQALAASSTPKTVVLDATTGAVLSLKAEATIQPSIVVNNPCQAGNACWVHARTPYADYGFAYTGTVNGNWAYRGTMYTHNHSTAVCWAPSLCSGQYGPNTSIGFSAPVTGTRVTNFT